MNARYGIGDSVIFSQHGTTRAGRVFGVEYVDDRRRKIGWHYVIHADTFELIDIHERDIAPMDTFAAA